MQTVGKFSLKNSGAFDVKLQFVYYNNDSNKIHVDGTGGFPVGKSETADPGNYGVPDGSPTSLYADVVWGTDNQATQLFTYQKGSPNTANYTISGITLNNDLVFNGIS